MSNKTRKSSQTKGYFARVVRSVSFDAESLSEKEKISKDRKRYIERVSAKALAEATA
ncbi:hypothetical protein HMF8227_02370 [Saliniradius amylolyticus]|uniref:Uncharacterized protein n=1 Tax=Saliniradius amylolyticus TaxID=2183582 RepID=A0A2S2E5K7_9ALTE|nr:hypothetical protein [Saliniradius amylolyticus]AWL12822.1 hypothetical protein HMF8227_02370 [Saliniradius amylolyticus]